MEPKMDAKVSSHKLRKSASEIDEYDQYYGLTKQEVEQRKRMAAKFGRKPTHLDPNTIEETKDNKKNEQPKSLISNFLNRKSANEKPEEEGIIQRMSSYQTETK